MKLSKRSMRLLVLILLLIPLTTLYPSSKKQQYPKYQQTGGYPKAEVQDTELAQAYANVLVTNEGNFNNASFLHKPTEGSGWTIANGLDARFTTKEDMLTLGVPQRIVDYIEKNNAFGTTGVPLPKGQKGALRMTKEEFNQVNVNIAQKSVGEMREYKTNNPNLNTNDLAYLAQIRHWAGSFKGKKQSKTTRSIGGKLVSPIDDLLKTGKADTNSLVKALEVIQTSYIGKGKGKGNGKGTYRYATVTRYIKQLKGK